MLQRGILLFARFVRVHNRAPGTYVVYVRTSVMYLLTAGSVIHGGRT